MRTVSSVWVALGVEEKKSYIHLLRFLALPARPPVSLSSVLTSLSSCTHCCCVYHPHFREMVYNFLLGGGGGGVSLTMNASFKDFILRLETFFMSA